MMTEQAMSEQKDSPVKLKIMQTRREFIRETMQQRRNAELDRRANIAAFMDRYESGLKTS